VHLDRVRGEAQATPKRGGGREAAERAARRAEQFYELARGVSAYLVNADAFAPPPPTVKLNRKPLPRVTRPIFVAHRGQSRGPLPPEAQNTRATIEQALDDGFEWIEIDVNLTKDGQLAVVHDSVASKNMAELSGVMTLREALDAFANRAGLLIELKPQNALAPDSTLAMRAALLVRERAKNGRIVMDSFSPFIASSLERHCQCPVGVDAPNRPLDSRWVDGVALEGLDWIYVDHRQASAELIRYAHGRGLRVAVFTVNDLREIEKLRGEWPDAVITDRAQLMAAFR
jgi:glycerophosphoryl diester phosphodiesterase